jgi:cysteinyl-tRNA synthetase
LYNTASRSKEEFTLPEGVESVRLYCCGPTVYHYAHIGNLRTYIFEDILRRTLEYFDFSVNHVVNITDVGHLTSDEDEGDDKMEKGAAREGKSVWDVADYYTKAFMQDIDRLNIVQPKHWCKATDHIDGQIKLVQTLEEKGYTYQTSDGIYFDSQKFSRYGEFANIDVEGLLEGSRIDKGEKKAPTDFALWKHSPKDTQRAMEWNSPWGRGFPGWHLECSAMALHFLGETLDIHCGGTDHVRIHHTNEIAQSECATGKQFSRWWMHGEFLRMDNDKMSKSKGEFLTIQLLLDHGFDPMDYRYFALNSHYRNYLNFTWEALEGAQTSLKNLHKKIDKLVLVADVIESSKAHFWRDTFRASLGDDLNAPAALGVLNSMIKDTDLSEPEKGALVLEMDKVFGLRLADPYPIAEKKAAISDTEIQGYILRRKKARDDKNWVEADLVRDELAEKGIVLKDSPAGTVWELI